MSTSSLVREKEKTLTEFGIIFGWIWCLEVDLIRVLGTQAGNGTDKDGDGFPDEPDSAAIMGLTPLTSFLLLFVTLLLARRSYK